MSSTRFNHPQYVRASVTNVSQPSTSDQGHTMLPPPLPAKDGSYHRSTSGFSDVATYLTKPMQRRSSGSRCVSLALVLCYADKETNYLSSVYLWTGGHYYDFRLLA